MSDRAPFDLAMQRMLDRVDRAFGDDVTVSHTRAAKILGIDPATLDEEARNGKIRRLVRGKRSLYTLPEVVAYLTRPATETKPCRSTGPRGKTGRGRRTGISTSSPEVVDFQALRDKRAAEKRNVSKR